MTLRRLPPLAVAFALMAAALVATTVVTGETVGDAFEVGRKGQALTAEEAVRADLGERDAAPTSDDLATMITDHASDGLRYIAIVDGRGRVVAEAGDAIGMQRRQPQPEQRQLSHTGDRERIEVRLSRHQARRRIGSDHWSKALWIIIEVEPIEVEELRVAARTTMAIGGLAAVTLFGVAIALVRRELKRQSSEATRERERRLASLGEMSAVLAHEIRNPLASLKGNAQLLAAMLPVGDKPRAKAD